MAKGYPSASLSEGPGEVPVAFGTLAQTDDDPRHAIPPGELYALQLGSRPLRGHVLAKYVICAPMRWLGRELRPDDCVHCEQRHKKYVCVRSLVRRVTRKRGQLVLVPRDRKRGETISLADVTVKGFVVGNYTSYRI